jgi:hypothetical protein
MGAVGCGCWTEDGHQLVTCRQHRLLPGSLVRGAIDRSIEQAHAGYLLRVARARERAERASSVPAGTDGRV